MPASNFTQLVLNTHTPPVASRDCVKHNTAAKQNITKKKKAKKDPSRNVTTG